jgi:outer membrane protein OmpA-like peptidoglycan-associated protein
LKTISTLGLLLAIAGTTGCASAIAPPELVSARTVYDRASKGPAATLNPTDLHTAKESLDAAEQSFEKEGDSQVTRDLGYTAERRTETAESRARAMQALSEKEQVINQMHATTAAQAKMTAAELARANQQLASKDQALQAQGTQLQNEVQRRQEAERRAAQAASDLAKLASVKQETRGMVITLSGAVLFTSGKSDLLPAAQVKLNDVAKALIEQDPDSKMVVEGHTDSQGQAAANQELSQKRAQAVRDYLVSRGIAADRITAQGFGPTRPIGENNSPEGRANNRRVEIVVQPKS